MQKTTYTIYYLTLATWIRKVGKQRGSRIISIYTYIYADLKILKI